MIEMCYYMYIEAFATVEGKFYWAVHNANTDDEWEGLEANGYEDSIPNAFYAASEAIRKLLEENEEKEN